MEPSFSYKWLANQLKALDKSHGLFSFNSNPRSGILLRHDVDFDVKPALDLALFERDLKLKGTYFFLTTSETYNPNSINNRRMIQEIASLGFEVGLHFDPSIYSDSGADELSKAARQEARMLENLVGREISSLSLHNPSIAGEYPLIPGFRNAYETNIFSAECYLSDSRMTFHTEPTAFFKGMRSEIGQLLLHPMHYSDNGDEYPVQMTRYLYRSVDLLNETMKVNSEFQERAPDGLRIQINW